MSAVEVGNGTWKECVSSEVKIRFCTCPANVTADSGQD